MPTPFVLGSREIPFIRTLPNGETRLTTIDLGREEYRDAANRFIAHGGRYLIRINEEGRVDLVAVLCRDGESDDAQAVVVAECDNGPDLIDTCRRMVLDSVRNMGAVQ